MQNLLLTQISDTEIRQLFREELKNFFDENRIGEQKNENEELGGIDLAIEITGLAKPTIYGLVHGRSIPHSKRGKKLYFSRKELTEWLRQGKRKTNAEIAIEAANYGQKEKEAFLPTKQRKRFQKV